MEVSLEEFLKEFREKLIKDYLEKFTEESLAKFLKKFLEESIHGGISEGNPGKRGFSGGIPERISGGIFNKFLKKKSCIRDSSFPEEIL